MTRYWTALSLVLILAGSLFLPSAASAATAPAQDKTEETTAVIDTAAGETEELEPPLPRIRTCPDLANWRLTPEDTVDIYTIDRTVVRGINPIAISSESLLKIWPIDSLDLARKSSQPAFGKFVTARQRVFSGNYFMIPLSSIDSISYRQPSPRRHSLMVAGFAFGAIGGAALGASVLGDNAAPGSESLDSRQLTYGIIGAFVGGLIIGAISNELSKNMHTNVTLRCR